ncbi:hypothetical protein FRC03_011332 [Tulasnella sp. 419]|nr:hypothetical protein FRC03_011332 [Tulasnella sp. 419]
MGRPPSKKRRKDDSHSLTLLDYFTRRPISKEGVEVIVIDDSDSDSDSVVEISSIQAQQTSPGGTSSSLQEKCQSITTEAPFLPIDNCLYNPCPGLTLEEDQALDPSNGSPPAQHEQTWRDSDEEGISVYIGEITEVAECDTPISDLGTPQLAPSYLDSESVLIPTSESKVLSTSDTTKKDCSSPHVHIQHDLGHRAPTVLSSASLSDMTPSSTKANAFSLLMSGRKEDDAWKAAEFEQANHNSILSKERRKGDRRKAPFYKVLQGMPIAVDAFQYGKIPRVTAYLLTHAHSDHYTNLSSSWGNGPIYCSVTTANLIKHMLKVDARWINPLPFDTPTILPDTGGVEVTLIEANHCPGSALFVFYGKQTVNAGDIDFPSPHVGTERIFRYLHCGDFRASPRIALHPAIKDKRLDLCYLDTTYLDPKHSFPPQKQVIQACANLASSLVSHPSEHTQSWHKALARRPIGDKSQRMTGFWHAMTLNGKAEVTGPSNLPSTSRERVLICVGTYSIGKERIVKAIAGALSSKVYCDSRKLSILQCQEDEDLHSLLTTDPYDAQVHMVPLQVINLEKLEDYFSRFKNGFSTVVGFRPTGWTFTAPPGSEVVQSISGFISKHQSREFNSTSLTLARNSSQKLKIYGIPYSEHSSFMELTCFALSIDVAKMIATVNVGNASSRGKMSKWFERWKQERRRRMEAGETPIVHYRDLDYW